MEKNNDTYIEDDQWRMKENENQQVNEILFVKKTNKSENFFDRSAEL